MKVATIALLSALATMAPRYADARCPNLCSGHGSCGAFDRCTCYPGWQAADCSQRKCPMGRSFATPLAPLAAASEYSECSNRGVCNRASGLCECFQGFEGKACQRGETTPSSATWSDAPYNVRTRRGLPQLVLGPWAVLLAEPSRR